MCFFKFSHKKSLSSTAFDICPFYCRESYNTTGVLTHYMYKTVKHIFASFSQKTNQNKLFFAKRKRLKLLKAQSCKNGNIFLLLRLKYKHAFFCCDKEFCIEIIVAKMVFILLQQKATKNRIQKLSSFFSENVEKFFRANPPGCFLYSSGSAQLLKSVAKRNIHTITA